VILPKSVTPARIATNFNGAIAAVQKMDDADIKKLDGVAAGGKQKRSAFHLSSVFTCDFDYFPNTGS
jgi:hypothetical protein